MTRQERVQYIRRQLKQVDCLNCKYSRGGNGRCYYLLITEDSSGIKPKVCIKHDGYCPVGAYR